MKTTSKKGFTLTEIIIVLAIGALIIIIAFAAIPTAKRMMRDAKRKADLESTGIAFKAYASAHEGCLPTWLDNGTISGHFHPGPRPVPPIPADCEASYDFYGHAPGTLPIVGMSPIVPSSKIVTGGYYDLDKNGIDPLARIGYQWHEIGPDYGNGVNPDGFNVQCSDLPHGDPSLDSRPTDNTPARIRYYREVDPDSLASTVPPARTYTPHKFWLGICLETGEEFTQEFDL